jgi:spermidine dehydrogenase
MTGISTGGFDGQADPDGPACLMFWGAVPPPSTDVHLFEQMRAARARMLAMSFADYEREIRTVLKGLLGPAGFDVERDILAITVNRWPHGYAHDYMDLWDPDWAPGEAPHLIARQRFSNLVFANADAGADAYTHTAIDEAWRAVQDLQSQV